MKETTVFIRKFEKKDIPFILRVNDENVDVLSPLAQENLQQFVAWAELFLIAEIHDAPVAFLIALREGISDYHSENYSWFRKNYAQFLYIDRIVIDAPHRGLGIGRKLYQTVFAHANFTGVPFVTAEIDTIPYNEPSLIFHANMGFQEVGVQRIRNNSIEVSLQKAVMQPFKTL